MDDTEKLLAANEAVSMALVAEQFKRVTGPVFLNVATGKLAGVNLDYDSSKPETRQEVWTINAAPLAGAEELGLSHLPAIKQHRATLEQLAGDKFHDALFYAKVHLHAQLAKFRAEVKRVVKRGPQSSHSAVALGAASTASSAGPTPSSSKTVHGVVVRMPNGKSTLAVHPTQCRTMLFRNRAGAEEHAAAHRQRGFEAYPARLRIRTYGDDGTTPGAAGASVPAGTPTGLSGDERKKLVGLVKPPALVDGGAGAAAAAGA